MTGPPSRSCRYAAAAAWRGRAGSSPARAARPPTYAPPIPPLAPAKFTGALYIAEGKKVRAECADFNTSLQKSTGSFVQTAAPKGAGLTPGMLGYMFWAAERPSTKSVTTVPPNSCEGGVGGGATAYAIPLPMPALRQS